MKSSPTPSTPTPRWYGDATSHYTPLDTQRLPRPGGQNETVDLAPSILGVILQDGTVALVDQQDYNLMRTNGWTGRWTARKVTGDNQYPSINHGDKIRPVARLILDARKGERVRYRNGNRNDLTRSNLILNAKGGAEIGSTNRTCPQAPVLCEAERARIAAAVGTAVGSASMQDRIAVAKHAVEQAMPLLHAVRQTVGGSAA